MVAFPHEFVSDCPPKCGAGKAQYPGFCDKVISTDHLGSIREMTDATGAIRARYDYDPYGRITKVSGDLEADFGFTGFYRHQASGLSLTKYRAYDANLGRWLSRDPLRNAEMSQGPNLYRYVGNNPISRIDRFGLNYAASWAAAGAVGGGGAVAIGSIAVDAVTGGLNVLATPAEVGLGAALGGAIGGWLGHIADMAVGDPPFIGPPGGTICGPQKTRKYGDDGYPETDRDAPHGPDHPAPGNGDHSHDWDRPAGGGPPTNEDRGPGRAPAPGDPPAPSGP